MSTKFTGLVLRARRKEIQRSPIEIGGMLDVSTGTISMVESGEDRIAFHRIQDYLDAYDLNSECYPAFVKLLYPDEWENILRMKEVIGEDWHALDNQVDLLINSGQFR